MLNAYNYLEYIWGKLPGFEIVPIRVSETCQNISGQVKCLCMVIRRTSPFFATRLTEVTRRHAPSTHISRQCISCWRAARCSWSRSVIPRVLARRCWAIIRGFWDVTRSQAGRVRSRDASFFQSFSVSWTQILRQLKNASMLNVGHVSQS